MSSLKLPYSSWNNLLTDTAAKKFLQELLGAPIRDKTKQGTYTSLIVGGVAVLAFILRAIARLPQFGGKWGADDWVMTAAIVCDSALSHAS
jgi:hypothetical protein